MDDDKYFLVMKEGNISRLQSNKFSILDDVKNVNIGNGMPVTLSMGVGIGEKTLLGNNESAVRAIDMALGRGGDQAVLRDGIRCTITVVKLRVWRKTLGLKPE